MQAMDLDDATFFTRSRQAQAHDDDDGEECMSEAALLKRKRDLAKRKKERDRRKRSVSSAFGEL